MLDDGHFDATYLRRFEAVYAGKSHRSKPEFAFAIRCPDVYVRGFLAFIRIEMKAPVEQAQHGRHDHQVQYWCAKNT